MSVDLDNAAFNDGLDDKDEFVPKWPVPSLQAWRAALEKAESDRKKAQLEIDRILLQKKAPKLMAHQKAFLALVLGRGYLEDLEKEGRARKGQPDKREIPFVRNTPKAGSGNVKQAPNPQHSGVFKPS